MAPGHQSPESAFSAALGDDPAPAQFGGYQYVGPSPTSQTNRGLQFKNNEIDSQDGSVVPGWDESNWGSGRIEQTQYPLNEPIVPPDLAPGAAAPAPELDAPILAPPRAPAGATSAWGLKAQYPMDATWVIGRGNQLGITTLTARAIVEASRFPGVSVRPLFGLHFLDGPDRTDLPSRLYDATVEARMYYPFSDKWIGEFAIAPGIFSDFENTSGDALRIVGRGVAYYTWSETLRLAAGGTYLDREDIAFLPIAGAIWTPSRDNRFELIFPQPRIAHCYRRDTTHERWIYLSGELGGQSWAIERSGGFDDVVSYRDLRLIAGIEFKYPTQSSWRFEAGYVFGREVEYQSHLGDYNPGDTTMIRAALNF